MHGSDRHDGQGIRQQHEADQGRGDQQRRAHPGPAAPGDPLLGRCGAGREHGRGHAVGVVPLAGYPGHHVNEHERGGDRDEPQVCGPPQAHESGDDDRCHQQPDIRQLDWQGGGIVAR